MQFGEIPRVGVGDMWLTEIWELVATAWWAIPVVLGVLILNWFTAKRPRRWR